ncbi:hypothetical protein HGP28_06745 [Vibrio sp. SM6]|uniref:Uncharacterized protein n=1 Tax=Vibrio agarilyticus TaxID=2726741 RepID=A0A7X8TPY4_9VIBR|nr:hypothetical protein [Vibrio agarilyticus]NLS12600.1 hypothetical protein [Vibrio agarilyticus]
MKITPLHLEGQLQLCQRDEFGQTLADAHVIAQGEQILVNIIPKRRMLSLLRSNLSHRRQRQIMVQRLQRLSYSSNVALTLEIEGHLIATLTPMPSGTLWTRLTHLCFQTGSIRLFPSGLIKYWFSPSRSTERPSSHRDH